MYVHGLKKEPLNGHDMVNGLEHLVVAMIPKAESTRHRWKAAEILHGLGDKSCPISQRRPVCFSIHSHGDSESLRDSTSQKPKQIGHSPPHAMNKDFHWREMRNLSSPIHNIRDNNRHFFLIVVFELRAQKTPAYFYASLVLDLL